MRNEAARGAFVTVARKGAQQAGSVFVLHNHLDGSCDLYGPAPSSLYDQHEGERLFEHLFAQLPLVEAETYLEKQKSFDPDLWLVETESGSGDISLAIAKLD